jgi:hypothetical protein
VAAQRDAQHARELLGAQAVAAVEMERRMAELERREREVAHKEEMHLRVQSAMLSMEPKVREEVRISAIQPPELKYSEASSNTTLDDWLYKLEQLFTQMRTPEGAWQERVRVAQLHWDRSMSLWWVGCMEAAAQTDTSVYSWGTFVSALRKHFISAGDAEAARLELFRLRMRSGEAMDVYMQRAVLLAVRAGALVDGRTIAALTLEGVDKGRFPFTVQSARRSEREAGAAGMSFAQMRAALTTGAMDEPQLHIVRGSGAHGSGGMGNSQRDHRGNGGGAKPPVSHKKQLRINAVRQELQALEEAGDADTCEWGDTDTDPMHVAPVGAGGALKCYKCGAEGHVVAECKSKKELRKCYSCNQVGHVRSSPKCPARKKKQQGTSQGSGKSGGSGQEGAGEAPQSKNE